jgi:hypothetical protein
LKQHASLPQLLPRPALRQRGSTEGRAIYAKTWFKRSSCNYSYSYIRNYSYNCSFLPAIWNRIETSLWIEAAGMWPVLFARSQRARSSILLTSLSATSPTVLR